MRQIVEFIFFGNRSRCKKGEHRSNDKNLKFFFLFSKRILKNIILCTCNKYTQCFNIYIYTFGKLILDLETNVKVSIQAYLLNNKQFKMEIEKVSVFHIFIFINCVNNFTCFDL